MNREELALLLADTAEAEIRYRNQLAREMYWRGYRQAEDDMAARWNEIARPAVRRGPDFAELERRRWGDGGREHFGAPRPGDYRGRGVKAA